MKHTLTSVLALIFILSFSAVTFIFVTATIQGDVGAQKEIDFLVVLFGKANATVVDVRQGLEGQGIELPPASLNAYSEAQILAFEAENLLQVGNYSGASDKILQSFQKLKETLQIIYIAYPNQPTEGVSEKIGLMRSTLDRLYEQLRRLEALMANAVSMGFDVSLLESKLKQINSLLGDASENLDEGELKAASDNLIAAKTLIESSLTLLTKPAENLTRLRIETYIEQTEERLNIIKERAISATNTASLTAVEDAQNSLNKAKDYLEKQLINATISELVISKQYEDQAIEYLKSSAISVNSS